MLCEVCGNDVPRTKTVSVEGTVLNACPNCAKFGTEVGPAAVPRRPGVRPEIASRLEARRRRMAERDVFSESGEEDLVEDYSDRIRRAREMRGWKQAELAAKINERATIIAKLESRAIVPDEGLIRRLEEALEIRLKEKSEPVVTRKSTSRDGLTLGDLMELEGEG